MYIGELDGYGTYQNRASSDQPGGQRHRPPFTDSVSYSRRNARADEVAQAVWQENQLRLPFLRPNKATRYENGKRPTPARPEPSRSARNSIRFDSAKSYARPIHIILVYVGLY